jgi:hypothetical protein
MDAYAPSTKILYFEILKKFHLHNICVFVKFHEEQIFFVVYIKKTEKLSSEKFYF